MQDLQSRNTTAIVGIGCRFRGAIQSLDRFRRFLREGGDTIRDVSSDRWNLGVFCSPDPATPGKTYARRGGFPENLDKYDPDFSSISACEADQLDPRQCLPIEAAQGGIEDMDDRWEDPALRNAGVFIGAFVHDCQRTQFADRDLLSSHFDTWTAMGIVANRISDIGHIRSASSSRAQNVVSARSTRGLVQSFLNS